MTNKKWIICIMLLIIWFQFAGKVLANVKLPYVLSSNMVLQRDSKTSVWGWAEPDENITAFFRDREYKTKTEKNGKWKIMIETGEAGGPFGLTIIGENIIKLENILVGDVWICSGQSNMELPLFKTNNSDYEISHANFTNIRFFNVPNNISVSPSENTLLAKWEVCSPKSAHGFSAVAYYFGRKIYLETGIPIGLISADMGATAIESWISEVALKSDEVLTENLIRLKKVDQENLAKEQARIYEEYYLDLYKLFLPDYTHEYLNPVFNDSSWMNVSLLRPLENRQDLKSCDGVEWYRNSFSIPQGLDVKNASLSFEGFDGNEITWINGQRIGETYFQKNVKRKYEILPGVLTREINQIVLRVENYSDEGGIIGALQNMFLSDGITTLSIPGNWKLRIEETHIPHNPSVMGETELLPNLLYTTLFNGMISPLLNFAIKGVIWYQGESNADVMPKALKYEDLLTLMISDWRAHWGIGDFPFYIVQLAYYRAETQIPLNEIWPFLREAQAKTGHNGKNTGMACLIDVGDAADIHPRNKASAGERLALNALKYDYGKDYTCRGPIMAKTEFLGDKALVSFNLQACVLKVTNKYGYINGFAIAGNDRKFFYAKASLVSDNQIEVHSEKVDEIKSVRFLWSDNPGEINLYNSVGLPAEPFRTDSW
jgi:sialate O-acetylesterase